MFDDILDLYPDALERELGALAIRVRGRKAALRKTKT